MSEKITITGLSVMTGLGNTAAAQQSAIANGRHGLHPLGELFEVEDKFASLPAGWIRPRSLLTGNRYGPTSNFAVQLAKVAIADAGWSALDLHDCCLFVGSSRGNAAGSLAPWPGRRAHRQMGTSNSMHSEMASAVSITFGIHGAYHVISNGCASGLDAIGFGYWALMSGMAPRVLIVSADLPLLPPLLQSYYDTGLLSRNGNNDPYSMATTGFLPAEGGTALTLELARHSKRVRYADIHGYQANSDAFHPLGLPADGAGIAACIRQAIAPVGVEAITAICPHASGTFAHGQAEQRALHTVFAERTPHSISLHLLKPFTGHAIGASGAIDVAILACYLRQQQLPANLPHLTGTSGAFFLASSAIPHHRGMVLKISVGMGGHNSVLLLTSPEE